MYVNGVKNLYREFKVEHIKGSSHDITKQDQSKEREMIKKRVDDRWNSWDDEKEIARNAKKLYRT